jgi:hypothetical protein
MKAMSSSHQRGHPEFKKKKKSLSLSLSLSLSGSLSESFFLFLFLSGPLHPIEKTKKTNKQKTTTKTNKTNNMRGKPDTTPKRVCAHRELAGVAGVHEDQLDAIAGELELLHHGNQFCQLRVRQASLSGA